jgi:hypothetical protein
MSDKQDKAVLEGKPENLILLSIWFAVSYEPESFSKSIRFY